MFTEVFNALYDQIKASNRLTYVDQSQFLKGFHEGAPAQEYTIIMEPAQEEEIKDQTYEYRMGIIYYIEIHVRVMLIGSTSGDLIVGNTITNKKGILEVVDDVKMAIEDDVTLGYNRKGLSTSDVNAGVSFVLSPSEKNIAVSISSKTPSGYDAIFCGDSTLNGDQVATNIQTALRALGQHADDGYYKASCSFNNSTKQFIISTYGNHPDDSVVVTAGASNDCSALLGFDNPTEVNGKNISKIEFESVIPNNTFFPVRYRIVPVKIWEEIKR